MRRVDVEGDEDTLALAKLIARLLKFLLGVAALVLLGLLVGLMVVLLPPLAWIGIIALAALFLLWIMPEMPLVNHRLALILFYVAFTAQLIFPVYYAFAAPGLPWISLRRLAWFPMVIAVCLLLASSADARARVAGALAGAKPVAIAVAAFAVFQFLSLFTSINFSESLKEFSNAVIYWYVPFFAVIFCLSYAKTPSLLFRIICWICIIAGIAGLAEFITHIRFVARLWPESLIAQLFAQNPEMFENITRSILRNGQFRANFIYTVSLSYGEFMAMGVPLCLHFALHGDNGRSRLLGFAATIACLAGIFASGARGAMLGTAIALPLQLVLWMVRSSRQSPGSMTVPITAVSLIVGVMGFMVLFSTSTRFKVIFTGGSEAASSTDARFQQWQLAMPKIAANPITGHGTGLGADIIGYAPFGSLTIDSYLISLLVEVGVVGTIAFFTIVLYGAYLLIRDYLTGDDDMSAYSVSLAATLLSFGIYRLVLSQRENHALFFVLVGVSVVQIAAMRRRHAAARMANRANAGSARLAPVGNFPNSSGPVAY